MDPGAARTAADRAAKVAKPAVLDRIALAMARHFIYCSSEEKTRQWQAKITDTHLRDVVEGEIGGLRERALRFVIRQGGGTAMQAQADTLAADQIFWLEVAMDEFLTMDPQGAWNWYRAVGEKLPPAKHDRIALAYGRFSFRMNDAPTGFHWFSKIADAKLRDEAIEQAGR